MKGSRFIAPRLHLVFFLSNYYFLFVLDSTSKGILALQLSEVSRRHQYHTVITFYLKNPEHAIVSCQLVLVVTGNVLKG
jgi:hypothetical protein